MHACDPLAVQYADVRPGCWRAQQSVKNCFVRGSVIRYVQLPSSEIDTELLQDATRREASQQKKDR
tara:strand:- start:903 stop:1100 length:198 start_codon:yes stop_codon:yes gene_type:complete